MQSISRRKLIRASVLMAFSGCAPAVWAVRRQRPSDESGRGGNGFVAELLDEFRLSRAYTLECAQAMPGARYDFRPVAEERSFGQQMVHIAEALVALFEVNIEGKKAPAHPFSEPGREPVRSKDDVLQQLNQAFDHVLTGTAALTDALLETRVDLFKVEMSKYRVLHFLLDHTTHHRAQTVVYLRINGIKPPLFRS